jgi:hypothetical protein
MIMMPRWCGLGTERSETVAQHTTVTLIDDLDGGKAAETVSFSLDGCRYEIDLSARNAKALRKVLGPFTEAARHVGPAGFQLSAPPRAPR